MTGPDTREDMRPWGLLAAASGMVLALGLFATFARTSFPEIGPAPNTLGIVSRTTEAGYPTRRDVAILGAGVAAMLAGAALGSALWSGGATMAARALGVSRGAALCGVALALAPHLLLGISLVGAPHGALRRLAWMGLASGVVALVATRVLDDEGVRWLSRELPATPLFVLGVGALAGVAASNAVATARGGGWRLHLLALGPALAAAAWHGLATAAAARHRAASRHFLAPAAHALAPLLGIGLLPLLHGRPAAAVLAVAAGLGWSLRRAGSTMRRPPDPGGPVRVLSPYLWNVLVPLVLLLAAFDPLHRDHPAGREMLFYAEEGQHLSWANRILHGQVPGRDFFMLYGPLMEYGHALWLRLAGATAPESRAYFEGMKLLGVLAVYAFGRAFLVHRVTALLATFVTISVAASPRVAFGLLPLWAVYRAAEEMKPGLVAAGVLAALAGLYSQEVGIASLLASCTYVLLDPAARRGGAARGLLRIGSGVLMVALPFALWLAARGALAATVENLVTYPTYVTMGYANSPFPRLELPPFMTPSFLARALLTMGTPLVWYVPPVIYALGLVVAALPEPRALRDTDSARLAALSLFGLVLFRAALGRSGPGKIVYVIPPALLVLVALGERALLASRSAAARGRPVVAALSGAGALLVAAQLVLPAVLGGLDAIATRQRRFVPPAGRGLVEPAHGRLAGGGAPEAAVAPVLEALRYVEETLPPGEPMLAIPNDAVLYFLADRTNPTRFDLFSQIVTDEHRAEVAGALAAAPPPLVVLDTAVKRVDDIADERQFGAALHLLWDRYRLDRRIAGRFLMLRPVERPAPLAAGTAQAWDLHADPWRLDGPRPFRPAFDPIDTRGYPRIEAVVKVRAARAALVVEARLAGGEHAASAPLRADGTVETVVLDMADRGSWPFDGPATGLRVALLGEAIERGELLSLRLLPRAEPGGSGPAGERK